MRSTLSMSHTDDFKECLIYFDLIYIFLIFHVKHFPRNDNIVSVLSRDSCQIIGFAVPQI